MHGRIYAQLLKAAAILALMVPALTFADQTSPPMVIDKLFDKVKANNNWKKAMATGKQAQVVFMSVSPTTNPKNEIGMETHTFDQVIIIAEGNAKVDLNGKTSTVKENDMIFIPAGTAHNVINLNANKALKLVSVYSETDIPANSTLEKKEKST